MKLLELRILTVFVANSRLNLDNLLIHTRVNYCEYKTMNAKMCKKDVLQAVILADDFTTRLNPAQNIFPSILMPVINIPLLDYMIETLIKSKIQEVFLYCSSHIDQLKKYIDERIYKDVTISLIISDGCRSLGDALRDIDTKGWIRGYFILIRGNTFTNTDLKTLLNIHRMKAEKDKGATMTMVLRNFGSMKDSYLNEEASLVVSDKSTNKILYYTKLKNSEKKVKLELNWFLDHNEVEINSCYLDTHIYLCSPSVLPLFADNFDFQVSKLNCFLFKISIELSYNINIIIFNYAIKKQI